MKMTELLLPPTKMHTGKLILINQTYPLYPGYTGCLGLIPLSAAENILLDNTAASVLKKLIEDIGGQNDIIPVSGYRTESEQHAIYSDSLKTNGAEFTRRYVALPGHSEHQTGLAIDLGLKKENIDFIRPHFPDTGICGRFKLLAAKYGFIQRYTAQKENITKIAAEPWHFRYTGLPHSAVMAARNMALEEYINYIKAYTCDNPLAIACDYSMAEIFYQPAHVSRPTAIRLPANIPYSISGNNTDGFIITLWR